MIQGKFTKTAMKNIISNRLKRLKAALSSQGEVSALLLGSRPQAGRSGDQFHQYRQSPDLYYLSGCSSPGPTLFVSSKEKRPILFASKQSKLEIIWDGRGEDFEAIADSIGADLVYPKSLEQELWNRLKGVERLFTDTLPGTSSWSIAQKILELPTHRRGTLPKQFFHSDNLLTPMRLIKDAHEVSQIKMAAKISAEALHKALPMVRPGISEIELAATIDYWFRMQDAGASFGTIVAGGPNAATLHHKPSSRKLQDGELVLLDLGAEYKMYAGDISRTLPVNGVFDETQAKLYLAVLGAQKAAISKVRDGVKFRVVYEAAAKHLTRALHQMGGLRGKLENLVKKASVKEYFPHGIGHQLGLDVHDITTAEGLELELKAGMVITIEPGLYFRKKLKKIYACGIRIEDDLLVTKKGAEILSPGFPKELAEIESLMR